jgi:hypothetical protein
MGNISTVINNVLVIVIIVIVVYFGYKAYKFIEKLFNQEPDIVPAQACKTADWAYRYNVVCPNVGVTEDLLCPDGWHLNSEECVGGKCYKRGQCVKQGDHLSPFYSNQLNAAGKKQWAQVQLKPWASYGVYSQDLCPTADGWQINPDSSASCIKPGHRCSPMWPDELGSIENKQNWAKQCGVNNWPVV